MPKGPLPRKFCGVCRANIGKRRDSTYSHVREEHGGKALTKNKALELYPSAVKSETVDALPDEMTVWVIDQGDGPKIWGELDLFVSETGIPREVPRSVSPEDTRRLTEAVSRGLTPIMADPPRPTKTRKSGLLLLRGNLVRLRRQVKRMDAILGEILEGNG